MTTSELEKQIEEEFKKHEAQVECFNDGWEGHEETFGAGFKAAYSLQLGKINTLKQRELGYQDDLRKLEKENKELREALDELSKPIPKDSRLNMDDIAECFKEIRQRFNLDKRG